MNISRIIFFIYGVMGYLIALFCTVYLIGFLSNTGVTKSIDGDPIAPLGYSILVDSLLIFLFTFQHSLMARVNFKKQWKHLIPEPIERSTYVIISSLFLGGLMYFWHPVPIGIWTFSDPAFSKLLQIINLCGWGIVLLSTFQINHFDLFGIRQVSFYLQSKPYKKLDFKTPGLYKYTRHPLYFGFLLAFWFTPHMTLAHLLYATFSSLYIIIAIRWEEMDLRKEFGESYKHYQNVIPRLIPFTRSLRRKK